MRFEVLGSHQRAHAGTPGRAPVVGHDRSVRHALFAGQTDARHARLRLADLALDDTLRLVGIGLAPQVRSVAQLGLAVVNPEVHRRIGAPGDEHAVVAGVAQFRAHKAADVRLAPQAGLRRARADRKAPGRGAAGAGERTGDPKQGAGRVERVTFGIERVPQQAHAQPAAADKVAHVIARNLLFVNLAGGEVNAKQSAGVDGHRCLRES